MVFCMIYRVSFLLAAFVFFVSCTHSEKIKKTTAKAYYEKALSYKEKGDYIRSLAQLTELRKQFFYSPYNQKALLLTGDIHFAQEKYPQAAKVYEKHLSLYPGKQTDYVLYHIGLSYKKQLPSRDDQDLSKAGPALKAFNALLNLKSSSDYKEKARIEKKEILDKQASKELKAILFYKSQGWSQAAFLRVEYFLKQYPDSPLQSKALVEAFELAELLNKASETFKEKLMKHYPDSEEAKNFHKNRKSSIFSRWRRKFL